MDPFNIRKGTWKQEMFGSSPRDKDEMGRVTSASAWSRCVTVRKTEEVSVFQRPDLLFNPDCPRWIQTWGRHVVDLRQQPIIVCFMDFGQALPGDHSVFIHPLFIHYFNHQMIFWTEGRTRIFLSKIRLDLLERLVLLNQDERMKAWEPSTCVDTDTAEARSDGGPVWKFPPRPVTSAGFSNVLQTSTTASFPTSAVGLFRKWRDWSRKHFCSSGLRQECLNHPARDRSGETLRWTTVLRAVDHIELVWTYSLFDWHFWSHLWGPLHE